MRLLAGFFHFNCLNKAIYVGNHTLSAHYLIFLPSVEEFLSYLCLLILGPIGLTSLLVAKVFGASEVCITGI